MHDLPELPDDALVVTPTKSAAPAAAVGDGEKPPLRVLDQAPAYLGKAAAIVVLGGLLPFMGHGGGWMTFAAAKVLVLLGAWFWMKQVAHNWGPPLPGTMGKLAAIVLAPKKKEEEKPKRRQRKAEATPARLEHPFPTALHVLSLLTVLLGVVALPLADPTEGAKQPIAMAELGMLAWAAYTWVHIFAYERWGHFNPLFPLMFLGMVVAGVMRVISGIGVGLGSADGIFSVLGGGLVAIGGGLAAYTIVEALRQAKREGDEKKKAAAEARKAARSSRKSAPRA